MRSLDRGRSWEQTPTGLTGSSSPFAPLALDPNRAPAADLAAGFQSAVTDILHEKTKRALAEYRLLAPAKPTFAIAGGVAANGQIRSALVGLCETEGVAFVAPPLSLCTDNAAMIAALGDRRLAAGERDELELAPAATTRSETGST